MNRYSKQKRKKWIPPAMTAEYLREATTQYLERYMPSEFQLKQVLWRKIDKNIHLRGSGNRSEYGAMIMEELRYRKEIGALDDQRFAAAWVESLHTKGKSKIQIRVKLQQKGIDRCIINKALIPLDDEEQDFAFEAAVRYARKRRFGPFQVDPQKRKERYKKDVAAMMRAGHSYENIKKIMACESLEDIFRLDENLRF